MVQAARPRLDSPELRSPRPIVRDFGVVRLAARPFPLELGAQLEQVEVAYGLVGPAHAPVIAVLGGISADHGVAVREDGTPGWWSALFGAGRAIDTERFRVLSFDFLGGNGRTTGPRTRGARPPEGAPPSAASGAREVPPERASHAPPRPFPEITTFDQARVLEALLDALEIDRIRALIGASYGGMVALAFSALFPERLDRAIVISAAHKSAPLATAWRIIQRQIVELASAGGLGDQGLALARALAMTTYRTGEEMSARFDGPRASGGGADEFPVWKYLEARGADYVERMHPEAFLTLSRSIDLHRVAPEAIRTPLLIVSIAQDQCVPPSLSRELARQTTSELVTLDSLYGHDAFLKETSFFSELFRRIES